MKTFFASLLFLLYEIILAVILDFLLALIMNSFLFDFLNWYNHANFFVQLIILIVGGITIFYLIFGVLAGLFIAITQPIINRFPVTDYIGTIAGIVFTANIIFSIYELWKAVQHFSLLTIIEMIMLSFVIISLNWTILLDRKNTRKRLLSPDEINEHFLRP